MNNVKIPLSAANLPDHTKRLLIKNFMPTLNDIAGRSAGELMLIKGFGAGSLLAVRRSLHCHGLKLLNDPEPGTPEFDALGLENDEVSYPWDH